MNTRLKQFLDNELEKYDGHRAPELPGWSPEMSFPICFDPDCAADEFWSGADKEEARDMVLLAMFYEPNTTDQLNGIWAFLLVKGPDNEIVMYDDEGAKGSGKNLDEFLATLIPPTDPRWRLP
jgi:hypothetical protein